MTETIDALVIDGSGFLGQSLLQVLQREGWTVQRVGTRRSEERQLSFDLRNSQNVRQFIEGIKPRSIIVIPAVSDSDGTDGCRQERDLLDQEIVGFVAEAGQFCGARLILYSSDEIYDGLSGPYAEGDRPNPITPSGLVLMAMEQIVTKRLPGASLILRTSMPFGWGRGVNNLAMQVWEHLQAGELLRVPCDHWGNPTYMEYLTEATVRLVQMEVEGIVHVAGNDRMSEAELAQSLAKAMSLDPSLIVPVPGPSYIEEGAHPIQRGLKTERLEQLLGTKPLTLSESLTRFRRQWRADTYVAPRGQVHSDEAGKLKQEIFEKVRQYHAAVHGPKPFVPLRSRVHYAGRVFGAEEMVNLVDSALDFWLTLGPYGEQFEQRLKKFFGSRDFLAVNSGSTANLLATMTLMSPQLRKPLRPGDEVITAAVGFPTTLAPIVHGGLIPVFVDAEVGTYNINPHMIEEAISEKTRAIVIAHTLGIPCDMDVIGELVRRHDLYLIEDCCDALGGTFRDRLLGTFGDLATLSCYPAHQITMGEGGGVIVNRSWLSRTARSIRDWGRDCWCASGESNTCGKRFGWQLGELPRGYDHKYTYSNIGYNFKPTDMQAAVGVAQLDRLERFIEARRYNFRQLYEGLAPYQDEFILPAIDPRAKPAWFGFPITVKNGLSRDRLVQWLENHNVETREIFGGNLLRQPAFQHIQARVHGALTESDRIMRDTFFIGVYPGLTEEMVEFTIGVIRSYFDRGGLKNAKA